MSLSWPSCAVSQVSPRSAQWFGPPFQTNIQTYKHKNIQTYTDQAAYYIDIVQHATTKIVFLHFF